MSNFIHMGRDIFRNIRDIVYVEFSYGVIEHSYGKEVSGTFCDVYLLDTYPNTNTTPSKDRVSQYRSSARYWRSDCDQLRGILDNRSEFVKLSDTIYIRIDAIKHIDCRLMVPYGSITPFIYGWWVNGEAEAAYFRFDGEAAIILYKRLMEEVGREISWDRNEMQFYMQSEFGSTGYFRKGLPASAEEAKKEVDDRQERIKQKLIERLRSKDVVA